MDLTTVGTSLLLFNNAGNATTAKTFHKNAFAIRFEWSNSTGFGFYVRKYDANGAQIGTNVVDADALVSDFAGLDYQNFKLTVIVDSTVTARMRRDEVIENNIQPGDVIVGFASSGQATYETSYNGGMGSNGLTSARHDVLNHYLAEKYAESYDHSIPEDLIYSGPHTLTEPTEIEGVDVGKLILSPTRTYLPMMVPILDNFRKQINGIIHCSGGAQTKVLHFTKKLHIVKDNMFALPPLFRMIQESSGTDWKEMYKVFNMGHRLEIYTNEKAANEMIQIAKEFNIDAQIVGHVEDSEKKQLTIKSEFGTFEY